MLRVTGAEIKQYLRGQKMKINFNYKGNKYIIVVWAFDCHLMEIQKQGSNTGNIVKYYYDDKIKLADFLAKLEK